MLTDEQKDRLRAWCAALRSGEFEQCQGLLRRDGNKRCCLGVACDVYMRDEEHDGDLEWSKADVSEPHKWGIRCEIPIHKGTYIEKTALPEEVQEYFGLDSRDPLLVPSLNITCQYANDNQHWSFDEIAAAVEEKYGL